MLFTVQKKICNGSYPRPAGDTILSTDKLRISYNKFKTSELIGNDNVKVNLLFLHGTGMTKAVWTYHIRKLYEMSSKCTSWKLNTVIASDAVGHGDSAVLNKGKLGATCHWHQGGKDLIELMKIEYNECGEFFGDLMTINIVIGHSYGGFQALYAAYEEPNFFAGMVLIEGVLYSSPKSRSRFEKIFKRMPMLLFDEFESEEELSQYYEKASFFKNADARVRRDLIQDEKIIERNEETGKITYRLKGTVPNQLSTYVTAMISLVGSNVILENLKVPTCLVTGAEATWNDPDAVSKVRKLIPKQILVQDITVPKGEHLLNLEMPEETVKIIFDFILDRVEETKVSNCQRLEIVYKGDRKKIHDSNWLMIKKGNLLDASQSKHSVDKSKL